MGSSCHACSETELNCKKSVVNIDSIIVKEEIKGSLIPNENFSPETETVVQNKNSSIGEEKQKNDNFKTRKVSSFKLTDFNKEFLIKALKKTVVFSQVSDLEIANLIKIMYKIECKVGQEIVNLGNPIVFFFVIKNGKFVVHDFEQEESKILLSDSIYGENSLFQVEKLNGSVECIEDAEIYALNRKDYQSYIKKVNIARLKEKLFLLKKCEIFSKLYV